MANIYPNYTKVLKKIAKSFVSVLKRTANVRSGALKRSIKATVKNNNITFTMLAYGFSSKVWSNGNTPFETLEEEKGKYTKELEKAFAKDVALKIKKTAKKSIK